MNVKKAITENESIKGPILYQFSTCGLTCPLLVLHVPQTVYFGFQPQIPHSSFFCFMSIFSWFAAQYRRSYFIFCSFKLKRKNSCPYFTLWVCLLKFKLSIHWERKCDLSGFAFNVAWLLVPERLVWIFQHLWMHNAQPWSRWATAAEDHTRYHCFKLRTANWGYKWHRLTKTRQKTKHKTKLD